MEKISQIENFTVDTEKLLQEYNDFIVDKLQDRINPYVKIVVQRKFHIILRGEVNEILNKMPYTKEIIERVSNHFSFKDVTYRVLHPCTSYRWHTDKGAECMHIPLITNEGCLFVYEDVNYRMQTGKLYHVNNGVLHTFVNAGDEHRVHLMFENIDGI